MVDSHALVGSCAQMGKRVHLSAAAQIGGVLEPVNASPVVIEDDVLVGGNCGVYEGTIVRKGAVLAAGTILTRGTPVFDLVNGASCERRRIAADCSRKCGGGARLPRRASKGKGAGMGSEPVCAGDREISRRQDGPEHGAGRPAAVDAKKGVGRSLCGRQNFAAHSGARADSPCRIISPGAPVRD